MNPLTISILVVAGIIIVFLVRHVERYERARAEAATAGRQALTAQEFAGKYFTGASVPIATRCRELFAKNYEYDVSRMSADDKLCQDLRFAARDALDADAFLRDLEREFSIKFSKTEARDMRTMKDIVEAILAHKRKDIAQQSDGANAALGAPRSSS